MSASQSLRRLAVTLLTCAFVFCHAEENQDCSIERLRACGSDFILFGNTTRIPETSQELREACRLWTSEIECSLKYIDDCLEGTTRGTVPGGHQGRGGRLRGHLHRGKRLGETVQCECSVWEFGWHQAQLLRPRHVPQSPESPGKGRSQPGRSSRLLLLRRATRLRRLVAGQLRELGRAEAVHPGTTRAHLRRGTRPGVRQTHAGFGQLRGPSRPARARTRHARTCEQPGRVRHTHHAAL
ncbi:uncharacterized protein LOC119458200 [Dermacentor silvarum]|uniref:uncharacterized protein LOC119458200 n=1 Tax=Dermacentor silvarum TaxID=543639 RepID=UPI001898B5FF|nr:uncharacterized protein LOC119458200 [Dermacentor silvarum]